MTNQKSNPNPGPNPRPNRGDRDQFAGDSYLWDKTGAADPLVAELEAALAPLRYTGAPPSTLAKAPTAPRRIAPVRWRPMLAAAAVLLLTCLAAIRFIGGSSSAEPWEFTTLKGIVRVGDRSYDGAGRMRVGQWLRTESGASVELRVANIGRLTIDGDSELQLLASREGTEQRIKLKRGRIDAFITARARLFFVDTPAAVAVDLGCAYELVVDENGDGEIIVTSGSVMLERDSHSVMLLAGTRCAMRRDIGPGTPYVDDAPAALREALMEYDFRKGGGVALDTIVSAARNRDWLTLWNLLPRVHVDQRERLVDRLLQVAKFPEGVTREHVILLDQTKLDDWFDVLEDTWFR